MKALAPAVSASPVPAAVLAVFFFQDFTLSEDTGRFQSGPSSVEWAVILAPPRSPLRGCLRVAGDPAVQAPGLRTQLPAPEDRDRLVQVTGTTFWILLHARTHTGPWALGSGILRPPLLPPRGLSLPPRVSAHMRTRTQRDRRSRAVTPAPATAPSVTPQNAPAIPADKVD